MAALALAALPAAEALANSPFFGSPRHDQMCERIYVEPPIIAQLLADAANDELPPEVRDDAQLRADLIQAHFQATLDSATRFKTRTCTRLNEIQVLGTHNSYKVKPFPSLQSLLNDILGVLAEGFEYSNDPFATQFGEQGVRQIEIDVFLDGQGGLFSEQVAEQRIEEAMLPPDPPHDEEGVLDQPGVKVLHIQDIDFRTHCLTLEECLLQVKDWSDMNPDHLPIAILVEAKDSAIPLEGAAIPEPFDLAGLIEVEDVIRSVFPDDRILSPDDVRKGAPTLEEVVTGGGWPRLGEVRGQVYFLLDNGGGLRDAYVAAYPSLAGAVFFTDSPIGTPEAAFVKLNGPDDSPGLIADLVEAGYIVRTRADSDTEEARANDTTRRDSALSSGAQFVSTDYPVPDPFIGTPYFVEIPGDGIARCNPINAPLFCEDGLLE